LLKVRTRTPLIKQLGLGLTVRKSSQSGRKCGVAGMCPKQKGRSTRRELRQPKQKREKRRLPSILRRRLSRRTRKSEHSYFIN